MKSVTPKTVIRVVREEHGASARGAALEYRQYQVSVDVAKTAQEQRVISMTPPSKDQLELLKMPELRKRAEAIGVPDKIEDDARDSDEPKPQIIALILAQQAQARP